MPLFGQTVVEIQLELENAELKRKIYELTMKLPMFGQPSFVTCLPEEIELTAKAPLERELRAIATLESRITPSFGMEVMGFGGDGKTKLWNQYFIDYEQMKIIKDWSALAPQLLEYLHQDFIERLARQSRVGK